MEPEPASGKHRGKLSVAQEARALTERLAAQEDELERLESELDAIEDGLPDGAPPPAPAEERPLLDAIPVFDEPEAAAPPVAEGEAEAEAEVTDPPASEPAAVPVEAPVAAVAEPTPAAVADETKEAHVEVPVTRHDPAPAPSPVDPSRSPRAAPAETPVARHDPAVADLTRQTAALAQRLEHLRVTAENLDAKVEALARHSFEWMRGQELRARPAPPQDAKARARLALMGGFVLLLLVIWWLTER